MLMGCSSCLVSRKHAVCAATSALQVAGLPVFGVAIPTVSGLRLVLERLGAAHGRRKVLWHNQREEPVM